MFIIRKLRSLSHGNCKKSQSTTDLTKVGGTQVSNPEYQLQRSKSLEQLNDDIISNELEDDVIVDDDYLIPSVKVPKSHKTENTKAVCEINPISSQKKVAIVNPTPQQVTKSSSESDDVSYQNVDSKLVEPTRKKLVKQDAVYQNLDSVPHTDKAESDKPKTETEKQKPQEKEYQNIDVVKSTNTDTSSDEDKNNDFEYELIQKPFTPPGKRKEQPRKQNSSANIEDEKTKKSILSSKKPKDTNKQISTDSSSDKISDLKKQRNGAKTDIKQTNMDKTELSKLKSSLEKKIANRPTTISESGIGVKQKSPVLGESGNKHHEQVTKTSNGQTSSVTTKKKPKPARPPPPNFSRKYSAPESETEASNMSSTNIRNTCPEILIHKYNQVHIKPVKAISLDNHYVNDSLLTKEYTGDSTNNVSLDSTEKTDDYFDMSKSRPGDVQIDENDDYMPMSLEKKCPLSAQ